MGWFRVLIETWWWVLIGALIGLVVGYFLGRLLKPRDVLEHPHFRALKAEFDEQHATVNAQAAQIDELERAAVAQRAETAKVRVALEACERARQELTEAGAAVDDNGDSGVARGFAATGATGGAGPDLAPAEAAAEAEVPVFDAAAASAAYGAKVAQDDLKIVEGIGPKIEELLHGAGIRTWRQLATAPVDTVRDVLRAGGDRFRMHDPASWATQARLAAEGAFAELKAFQESLTAGRE